MKAHTFTHSAIYFSDEELAFLRLLFSQLASVPMEHAAAAASAADKIMECPEQVPPHAPG